jgi:hypothetical protein
MNIQELEDYQSKIYNGLKTIGEEIASFYLDGVRLVKDDKYLSKAYLIAHIAREIDGGLREILAPKDIKEKLQKTMTFEDEHKEIKGHVASILVALDSEKDMPLTKEYINVSMNFVKFAHRSGAYKKPRNPEEIIKLWKRYELILLKLFGDYINQLKHLDRILKFDIPSEYILETLPNFFTDESKKIHFFENLKNTNWFKPMYEKGFFNAYTIEKNKHWRAITYLTFVSEEIHQKKINSKNSKYIVDLIFKLTNSNNYEDYSDDIRLWYFLFKILSNLPKTYLGSDFLAIYPKFFSSKDSSLTGKGAIEFVESYFLENEISENGKLIIEGILMYAFDLTNDKNYRHLNRSDEDSIFPKVESYLLKDLSESIDFCQKISCTCSNSLLYYIADKLEIYLINYYHEGIFRNSIFFENNRTSSNETIDVIYTDFLKKTISHISLIDLKRHREITETFISSRYKHYYIRRLCFYVISLNWENTKDLFINLVKNNDENHCFSNWENHEDLYFLLEKVSELLCIGECEYIEKIINFGSQNESFYHNSLDDFKIYWLSALKNNKYFTPKFEKLSLKQNRSYESLKPKNKEFITWGSSSPLSKKELTNINPSELAELLRNFDPPNGFKVPTSDGLASVIEDFFSENPDLFTDNFQNYLNIQFIYSTKIIYGLSKSLETNKKINWEKTLLFIDHYIQQDSFKRDELKLLNDNKSYDIFSFIIASCRLISKGNNPETSYDNSLLPIVEKIFKEYLLYIAKKSEEALNAKQLGSLMTLYNSNNGVILTNYFYFVLRKANLNSDNKNKQPRWELSEKEFFSKLTDNNHVDIFMLLAHCKSNFLFVDYEWTMQKIKSIPSKAIEIVKAFFGVHILSNDPSKPDYEIFKNVYKTAINENWKFDNTGVSNSLERHIGIFYLFGYDNFENDSLIETFFKSTRVENIGKLIHFYSFYVKPHVDTLKLTEQQIIKNRIIVLWEKCYEVLIKIRTEDSKIEISGLINLIQYIDKIDDKNFNLIHKTALIAVRHWELDTLLKHLNRLKNKIKSTKNANYIVRILNDTIFLDIYYFRDDNDDLFEIIEYLFELNIESVKVQVNKICNNLAKKGLHFSTPLYEKYNP